MNHSIAEDNFDTLGNMATPSTQTNATNEGRNELINLEDDEKTMLKNEDEKSTTGILTDEEKMDGNEPLCQNEVESNHRNDDKKEEEDKSVNLLIDSNNKINESDNSTISTFETNIEPILSPINDNDEDSDPDEPLLSGSGIVSRECTETELLEWGEVLAKWRIDLSIRPKDLDGLVKRGIPGALRSEVWQLLASCQNHDDLIDEYKILISQTSAYDKMIRADISRTFPANEKFRETGSPGQDALYRLCTAYANYDKEIGYCQGLTFVTAALLLQLPEEQAFCLLVQIMHSYGVRNLFRSGFEVLQLRFYQLECLMVQELNDLYHHFLSIGVEPHMFASQWFLTLFTAKFPLHAVFFILDLFLLQGIDTILQVSLALLKQSRNELLKHDFEGALKHFRVHLPRKYKNEENSRKLLAEAINVKTVKLAKYEKLYLERQRKKTDSVERLTRENELLLKNNVRLERENQLLANDLVNGKIKLRRQLDIAEDKADTLNKELMVTKVTLAEIEEEKKRLDNEIVQVKEVFRRELYHIEVTAQKDAKINCEYKTICSSLSNQLERERAKNNELIILIKQRTDECDQCKSSLEPILIVGGDGVDGSGALIDGHKKFTGDSEAEHRIRELENELARTKLALVEAECQNQELNHQMSSLQIDHHKDGKHHQWPQLFKRWTANKNANEKF